MLPREEEIGAGHEVDVLGLQQPRGDLVRDTQPASG